MAKKLFGWTDKRYNQEYQRRIGTDGKEVNGRRTNQVKEELHWKQLRKKKKLSKEIWG